MSRTTTAATSSFAMEKTLENTPTGSSSESEAVLPLAHAITLGKLPKGESSDDEIARKRQSERRSRQRRKENLESMRQQVKALECALANVMFVRDSTEVWDEFSDDDSVRMREFLRRSTTTQRRMGELESEREELHRMLRQYRESVSTMRRLMKGMELDDWSLRVSRWRAVTHATFNMWTLDECRDVINDALKQIRDFSLRDDMVSSGMDFHGWRDRRRIDTSSCTMHFSFHKYYEGVGDAMGIADKFWEAHLNGDEYRRTLLGPNVKVYYEVLQRVTSDICIIRCVEEYPTMPMSIHKFLLLFRVRTEDRYLHVVKSLPPGDIGLATDEEDAIWATTFHWSTFDILSRDAEGKCTKCLTAVNGTTGSEDPQYALRWMIEALVTVVRFETLVGGQRLLGF
ncbi:hypothetical protein Poli38472_006768 [Pythium oligandrum]|uniref:Uncharacterized protein n=1 Tax=Pythium oligandrum TaxID=41045 RepID=A0A8K1FFF6_PYTOL|nr:hypothetical protein Poli38472_006768 [Pythium oligandrum]|eukprot:TMW56758.1 hypothetical protein Poli38472_006768 [Pythium oligandrum]